MKQFANYVSAKAGKLNAGAFPIMPVVSFEDGSNCSFNYAFYEKESCVSGEVLVVYTEYCGYHCFPMELIMSVQGVKGAQSDAS